MAKHEVVSFGDESLYTGSSSVPEGDYALEFNNVIDRGREGKGVERLAVKISFHPLEGGKVLEYTYGMGKAAHLSMRPNPDNPKQLVRVPNGPTPNFNNQTKWAIFKDSLHQSGLEKGVLTDTFETIDGVHVHIQGQPEPKEWSEMNRNSDLAGEGGEAGAKRTPGMIPVVSMIMDDGKPWEGGGGIPEEGATTKTAPKPAPKTGAKPAAKAKAKAAVEEDIFEIAKLGVSDVMSKNENGCSKTALKAGTFAWISDKYSDERGQEFMNDVADDSDAMGQILAEFGYKFQGIKVVPAE